jgi:hypothetical protein
LKAVHILKTIYKNTGKGRISALTGHKWQHLIFLNAVCDFMPWSTVSVSNLTMVTARIQTEPSGQDFCFVL